MERDREPRHQGSSQGGYSREQGMGHHQSFGDRAYDRGERPQLPHTDERWGQDRSYGDDRKLGEDRGMGRGQGGYYSGQGGQSGYGSGSRTREDHDQGYSQRMFGDRGGERTTGGWYGGGGNINDEQRSGSYFRGAGHRGKGPKNFTRSDDRIKERVSEALQDDDEIDASEIEIEVRSGEVVLKGTVEDRRMKRIAEECAERVPGVSDVQNQLKVGGNKWQLSSRGNQDTSKAVGTSESDRSKNRA
jgi:osmotically-inducible protein OsmY